MRGSRGAFTTATQDRQRAVFRPGPTRSILSTLALLTLTVAGALVNPVPAHAVSCYGDYCSGQQPDASGCGADAYTAFTAESDVGVGRLDIRYSPTCKTNWGRWVEYPRGWTFSQVPLVMKAVQEGTGYEQIYDFGVNGGGGDAFTTYYTPMIYSPEKRVRAEMFFQCTSVGDCVVTALTNDILTTDWA